MCGCVDVCVCVCVCVLKKELSVLQSFHVNVFVVFIDELSVWSTFEKRLLVWI